MKSFGAARLPRVRQARIIAAIASLLLLMPTARELTFGGLLFPRSLLLIAGVALTLLSLFLIPDLHGLLPIEGATLGAAPAASLLLLCGAIYAPSVFLICFALCAAYHIALRLLLRAACGKTQTAAQKKRGRRLARVWTLPPIAIALLFIAFTIVTAADSSDALLARTPPDREELFALFQEELSAIEPTRWVGYDEKERLAALKVVAELECRWLGIEPPTLVAADLGDDVLGQYDNKQATVFLSTDELCRKDAFVCISTLLHELRHCYQFRVVESIDWSRDKSMLRYYSEAAAWRNELMSYVSGGGDSFDEYYEQAIEVDARDYAKCYALDYIEILS